MKAIPTDHHIIVLECFICTMTIQSVAIEFVTIFHFNHVISVFRICVIFMFRIVKVNTYPTLPIHNDFKHSHRLAHL